MILYDEWNIDLLVCGVDVIQDKRKVFLIIEEMWDVKGEVGECQFDVIMPK